MDVFTLDYALNYKVKALERPKAERKKLGPENPSDHPKYNIGNLKSICLFVDKK